MPINYFDPEESYDPDERDGNELEGYFHCWTEEYMDEKERPYIEKKALVENAQTGKIDRVHDSCIVFLDRQK